MRSNSLPGWGGLLLLHAMGCGATVGDDLTQVPFPAESPTGSGLRWYWTRGTIMSTGRRYVAHVAVVDNPSHLSFEPSGGSPENPSCGLCRRVTSTSRAQGCLYATNAGFFQLASCDCVGSLVSNGRVVQLVDADQVNFGIMRSSEPPGYEYIVGTAAKGTLSKQPLWQLVTGMGWLVRQGRGYITFSTPNTTFVTEKAPRTAIGIFNNGSALLYQVDGEEDVAEGPDLFELTELLLELGDVAEAVNLDGGGSSVSVYKGRVISSPTCMDTSVVCERPVTSIVCVSEARNVQI